MQKKTKLRERRKMKIFKIILTLAVLILFSNLSLAERDPYLVKRGMMVEHQIKDRGVTDKEVLKAMKKVKRHLFVPPYIADLAYQDSPLPIGERQTISQPYIVAFMTEAAKLKRNDKVLEVGTGSGYQAAVLARIVKEVYTIEIIKRLADSARYRLKELGYKNVHVKWGDGYKGWPEEAPFDAIIVTAAPDEVPEELLKQLKLGGRMVVPVGAFYQELYLITKTKDGYSKESLLPVRFVPMVHGE